MVEGANTGGEGTDSQTLTFGEHAVGLTFNPGGDPAVNEIKQLYAKIIDRLHEMRIGGNVISADKGRLIAVAITEAQGAQMWAVKAITWKQ